MLRLVFFSFFFSVATGLSAQQPLFGKLASALCDCMESITTEVPRNYARGCLRSVAIDNRKQLTDAFDRAFNPDRPTDLDLLASALTRQLTDNCPILETLFQPAEEAELRWSDQPLPEPLPDRLVYPKSPPPDKEGVIMAERPPSITFKGVLLERSRSNFVFSTEGKTITVEIPPKLRRAFMLPTDLEVEIVCRREWRLEDSLVVFVLVGNR